MRFEGADCVWKSKRNHFTAFPLANFVFLLRAAWFAILQEQQEEE